VALVIMIMIWCLAGRPSACLP